MRCMESVLAVKLQPSLKFLIHIHIIGISQLQVAFLLISAMRPLELPI
jgi:hypothetical protein